MMNVIFSRWWSKNHGACHWGHGGQWIRLSTAEIQWQGIGLLLGGSDKCAILDFSQRHLTGHSWTYLRDFQKRRFFFFEKLPPCTAKTVFENPKGGAFGCWKKKFFKSSFYQSHVMAFGLTIPKWYNTWVLQIFFVNIWCQKYFSKYFFQFFEKIFSENIFNT